YLCAGLCKRGRDGGAESAGCAGDECDTAIETEEIKDGRGHGSPGFESRFWLRSTQGTEYGKRAWKISAEAVRSALALARRWGLWCRRRGWPRRLANDEFRIDTDGVRLTLARELLEQRRRGKFAHRLQGLANRSEAGNVVVGGLNVVEADDGEILRNTKTAIVQCANGADRRDVVEADDGGEVAAAHQQLLRAGIAEFGRLHVFLEMHGEIGRDAETKRACDLQRCTPTRVRVGAELLPAHECNLSMTKTKQMTERELRSACAVEHDVGDPGEGGVGGDGDGGGGG